MKNHSGLAKRLEPHVAMYAIVYRDPNGTPDNEQDDWYSCIADRVPARHFVSIVENAAATVENGSINRIKARKAAAAAAATKSSNPFSSFLRSFFTSLVSDVRGTPPHHHQQDELAYSGYGRFTNLAANLPCVSHYDPIKDIHVYVLCAIDTCISFRVNENNHDSFARVVGILRTFYESQVNGGAPSTTTSNSSGKSLMHRSKTLDENYVYNASNMLNEHTNNSSDSE